MVKINNVAIALDCSYSMKGISPTVDREFQNYIKELIKLDKKCKQQTYVTLVLFSDTAWYCYKDVPVKIAGDYQHKVFNRTAMLDGVGMCIDTLKHKPATERCIVMCITDGIENCSQEWNKYHLSNAIKKYQKQGNFTFVFQVPPGAKKTLVEDFGIPEDNVQEWEGTSAGFSRVSRASGQSLGTLYSSQKMSTETFYADLNDVTVNNTNANELTRMFRVKEVGREGKIKEFVEEKLNVKYIPGHVYYQLIKQEYVDKDKDILVQDKKSGKIYGGYDSVRKILGLPTDKRVKLDPLCTGYYNIFIQSKSYNRILPYGTKVLVKYV